MNFKLLFSLSLLVSYLHFSNAFEEACPAKFEFLKGYGCYNIGSEMTWTKAFYYCQDMGGRLVFSVFI